MGSQIKNPIETVPNRFITVTMITADSSQLVYKYEIGSTRKNISKGFTVIPYLYVYENRLVISPRPDVKFKSTKRHENSLANLKNEKLTGKLSKSTKHKNEQILTTWLNSINTYNNNKSNKFKSKKYYPVFITLTLSSKQVHTDQVIRRKLLIPFIDKLKYHFGVKYYFHRSESQKNGNIHFHLIVDKYINHVELRKLWNTTQEKLGYISIFAEKYNHSNPNSTDVKSAKDVKNFVKYVLKYINKDEKYRAIKGRIWGMSDELRSLKQYKDTMDDNLNDLVNEYIINSDCKVIVNDFYTIIYFDTNYYNSNLYHYLSSKINEFYLKVYDQLYIHKPIPDLQNYILKYIKPYCSIPDQTVLFS